MAFTLTNVELATDVEAETYLAKENISDFLLVTLDDNLEAQLADATDSAKSRIEGIAIRGATANNVVAVVSLANLQVSNALTLGDTLILATAGQVQISNELAAGQFLSIFGAASATNRIDMNIWNSGIQK